MLEVEDVAGALAWLGERGIRRVALFGTSMGGMAAIAAVAVLGDGSLTAADAEPDPDARRRRRPRPLIVAVVADSTAPEAELPVANRMPTPFAGSSRLAPFDAAARKLGADPRDTEPGRVVGARRARAALLDRTARPTRPCRSPTAAGSPPLAGPDASHWTVEAPITAARTRRPGRTMSVG